jgi:hypothetical protein
VKHKHHCSLHPLPCVKRCDPTSGDELARKQQNIVYNFSTR